METNLIVKTETKILDSNLDKFEKELIAMIESIPTKLKSDNDFVDASKNIKSLTESEKILKGVREQILNESGLKEVSEKLTALEENARDVRLKLNKKVETEKEKRKTKMLNDEFEKVENFLNNLEFKEYIFKELCFNVLAVKDEMKNVIKGKSKKESMEKALAIYRAEKTHEMKSLDKSFAAKKEKITKAIKGYSDYFSFRELMESHGDVDEIISNRITAIENEKQKAKEQEAARIAAKEKQQEKQSAPQPEEVQENQQTTSQPEKNPSGNTFEVVITVVGTIDQAKLIARQCQAQYSQENTRISLHAV
jgi:hypothetical protein